MLVAMEAKIERFCMTAFLLLLRGFSLSTWLLIAASAGLLYERHAVHVANAALVAVKAQDAADEAKALKDAVKHANEVIDDLKKVIDDQTPRITAAEAAASAAGDVVDKLRSQLAKISHSASSKPAGAPSAIQTTGPTVNMLADMLGQCEAESAVIAQFADESYERGVGCERSYDALTPPVP